MNLNNTVRNQRLNVIRDFIDSGGAAAKLIVYSGAKPAKGGAATTALIEFTLAYPCAPNASNGQLAFSPISSTAAIGDGVATWARIQTSSGTFVMDCEVGDLSTSAPVRLSDTSITSGRNVNVTLSTITEANA